MTDVMKLRTLMSVPMTDITGYVVEPKPTRAKGSKWLERATWANILLGITIKLRAMWKAYESSTEVSDPQFGNQPYEIDVGFTDAGIY